MWVIVKTMCFYNFTINSRSKLKNSTHYSQDIYQEKLATKFKKGFHGGLFEWEILKFLTTALLLKNII